MKKIAAAALAATMTLSVAAAPAEAQTVPWTNEKDPEFTSSVQARATDALVRALTAYEDGDESEAERIMNQYSAEEKFLLSSYENDKEKGYKYGTTFDIIWGTLLGVAVLGGAANWALQQGLIQLPF